MERDAPSAEADPLAGKPLLLTIQIRRGKSTMKTKMKVLIFLAASVLQSSLAIAQSEPLSVHLNVRTRWGETTFLQGVPIRITVSLLNAQVRRAEEDRMAQWREQARQAEAQGRTISPLQPYEPPAELLVRLSGSSNIDWLSGMQIHVSRVSLNTEQVLKDFRWSDNRVFPETVEASEIVLGKYPVWATYEIPPNVSAKLEPGEYRVTVTYPNAAPDTFNFKIKVVENDKERAVFNYEYAEYNLRLGKYDEAIKFAQLALGKLAIDHDKLYLTLGKAYEGKGALAAAVEMYERFLQTYERSETWGFPSMLRGHVEDLRRQLRGGG
jgi:tetratricopeptide (TPR) repeat protein